MEQQVSVNGAWMRGLWQLHQLGEVGVFDYGLPVRSEIRTVAAWQSSSLEGQEAERYREPQEASRTGE
jgi:hypothetical protein